MGKKKRKRIILCIVTGILCLVAAGCKGKTGGSGEVDAAHTYTWWMMQGEDSSYYSDYHDNPAVEYMLTKNYKGENDKDTKVDFQFQIPAAGSAKDNLTTIISTGDYADIMDMSLYGGSIVELYQDGIAQDITEYVENYMPNYMAYLDANPDMKLTATNVVNGEVKYLQLYSYAREVTEQWGGYCYRRDWLVKYGKNPNDGSAFSGEFTDKNEDGTWNTDSWVDNVIFPSGGSDPVYISDWEWMLGIFQTAIDGQGITDGYPMSLPYCGYNEMGDLLSAFGGGGGHWYKNLDNKVVFGVTSDNFRTYLQAMSKWYSNGWIDKAFPEHATDMFYAIDLAKIHQGKVGLWYGQKAELMARIDIQDEFTTGAMVFAAKPPINDIYGTDEQKNVTPYCFYQQSKEVTPIIITDKAAKKDMIALCSFLDYTFTDEAQLLHAIGLNKEQYEATQNEFYKKYGMTEGDYTVTENESGIKEIEFVDAAKADLSMQNAAKANRLFGLTGYPEGYLLVNPDEPESYTHNYKEWLAYLNTGRFSDSFTGQLSAEDSNTFSKIETNIREFTSKNVPAFIQGTRDPNSDADWEAFKKAIGKYGPETNTQLYQTLLDQLNQ